VAGVLASAIAPPVPTSRKRSIGGRGWEWLWLGFIVVDIGFGALFAARDAAAAWPTWPGYQGRAFPPFDQLVSYAPVWLNFTFNQYTIQLVHRTLSAGLWSAALWQLIAPVRRAYPMKLGIVRFGLITAQMVTGISTLVLGVPAVLSVVHQVGSICLLVFSFVVLTEVNAVAPGTARLLKSA
jgi:heme A synthase